MGLACAVCDREIPLTAEQEKPSRHWRQGCRPFLPGVWRPQQLGSSKED